MEIIKKEKYGILYFFFDEKLQKTFHNLVEKKKKQKFRSDR